MKFDPDAALGGFRQAIARYNHCALNGDLEGQTEAAHHAARDADALDEWLTNGGQLPQAWTVQR